MSIQVNTSTQHESEQSVERSTPPESASESSTTPDRAENLPLDVVFDMLSSERRRQVLHYLLSESETTTLSDLAEHIAAIENDKPVRALSSQERKRVYVGLYQCHLPRLADVDVVDYDSNRGTVELGDNAEVVASYLPAKGDSEDDRRWQSHCLAVAVVGAGSLVVGTALYPHALLAGFSVGLCVASICLLALTRLRSGERWPTGRDLLGFRSDERSV